MRWITEFLAVKWGHAGIKSAGKNSSEVDWEESGGQHKTAAVFMYYYVVINEYVGKKLKNTNKSKPPISY